MRSLLILAIGLSGFSFVSASLAGPDMSGVNFKKSAVFKATTSTFIGEAEFEAGAPRKIQLIVNDDGSPLVEKFIPITFQMMARNPDTNKLYPITGDTFKNTKLDTDAHTLDVAQEFHTGVDNFAYWITISCRGIKLGEPKYAFQCRYVSTLLPKVFILNFRSK
jgi:hypothetical protein